MVTSKVICFWLRRGHRQGKSAYGQWLRLILAVGVVAGPVWAQSDTAETHEVTIENGQFSETQMDVVVGDTLMFHNLDLEAHSPFSLSETQMFDLGEMKTGDQFGVELKRPGTIDVTCGIHGEAMLRVLVRKERLNIEPKGDSYDIGNDTQPKIFGPPGLLPQTKPNIEPDPAAPNNP